MNSEKKQYDYESKVISKILVDLGYVRPKRLFGVKSIRNYLFDSRKIDRININGRNYKNVIVTGIKIDKIRVQSFHHDKKGVPKVVYLNSVQDYWIENNQNPVERGLPFSQVMETMKNLKLENIYEGETKKEKRILRDIKKSIQPLEVHVLDEEYRVEEEEVASLFDEVQEVLKTPVSTVSNLRSTFMRNYSLDRFYTSVKRMPAGTRRWLSSQSLIVNSVRVPGPVRNIFSHPIVGYTFSFLRIVLRGILSLPRKSIETIRYLGLDLYFVRAKEQEVQPEVTDDEESKAAQEKPKKKKKSKAKGQSKIEGIRKVWDNIENQAKKNDEKIVSPPPLRQKQNDSGSSQEHSDASNVDISPKYDNIISCVEFKELAVGQTLSYIGGVFKLSPIAKKRRTFVQEVNQFLHHYNVSGVITNDLAFRIYQDIVDNNAPSGVKEALEPKRLNELGLLPKH